MLSIGQKVVSNIVAIFGDMGKMIADLCNGQWEQAGIDFGDILLLSMGELPPADSFLI